MARFDALVSVLDWSPHDQSFLYSIRSAKGDFDIRFRKVSDDPRPAPFLETAFNENGARFSPDGKWVAYVSDESGSREIYVRSFPESAHQQRISMAGGESPVWRRDGTELFYNSPDGALISVPVDLRSRRALVRSPAKVLFRTIRDNPAFDFAVAPDGERFLLITPVPEVSSSPLNVILDWTRALEQ